MEKHKKRLEWLATELSDFEDELEEFSEKVEDDEPHLTEAFWQPMRDALQKVSIARITLEELAEKHI